MAQFVAYRKDVEGNINLLAPYFNADTRGKEKRLEVFKKHGIDLNKQTIYPMQTILNYFKDLAQELGDMNLFLIGKISGHEMPGQDAKNFKELIEMANIVYHTIYTINGKPMYNPTTKVFEQGLGSYTVQSFDENKKEMVIVSNTPFTSKSDEGLFTGLFEKFKPAHIQSFKIMLDITKERRAKGADSCTFIVTWQ